MLKEYWQLWCIVYGFFFSALIIGALCGCFWLTLIGAIIVFIILHKIIFPLPDNYEKEKDGKPVTIIITIVPKKKDGDP